MLSKCFPFIIFSSDILPALVRSFVHFMNGFIDENAMPYLQARVYGGFSLQHLETNQPLRKNTLSCHETISSTLLDINFEHLKKLILLSSTLNLNLTPS